MKKLFLSALICLSLSISNAQALLSPELVLYTDATIMTTSYVAFVGDTTFVNFPCHFWTEEFINDSTGTVADTSEHFYYDKNDPDADYRHTLTYAFGSLEPQTLYFYRQHAVDTNGNHYYSQYTAMKTAGVVSAIAEPVEKTCSVRVIEKQLQVKSTAEYMNGTLQVYSVSGATVVNRKIENEDETFDVSSQPTGYYIVAIRNGATQVTKRIFIE